MVKISPSILSSDYGNLESELKKMEEEILERIDKLINLNPSSSSLQIIEEEFQKKIRFSFTLGEK